MPLPRFHCPGTVERFPFAAREVYRSEPGNSLSPPSSSVRCQQPYPSSPGKAKTRKQKEKTKGKKEFVLILRCTLGLSLISPVVLLRCGSGVCSSTNRSVAVSPSTRPDLDLHHHRGSLSRLKTLPYFTLAGITWIQRLLVDRVYSSPTHWSVEVGTSPPPFATDSVVPCIPSPSCPLPFGLLASSRSCLWCTRSPKRISGSTMDSVRLPSPLGRLLPLKFRMFCC